METVEHRDNNRYLACERKGVFLLLMMSAGMMGAYTYNLRGGMFCTNHIRQVGSSLAKFIRHRENDDLRRGFSHFAMLICFFAGGVFLTALCPFVVEKSIWLAIIPLVVDFMILAHADIFDEHDLLDKKPAGH